MRGVLVVNECLEGLVKAEAAAVPLFFLDLVPPAGLLLPLPPEDEAAELEAPKLVAPKLVAPKEKAGKEA